MPGPELFKYNIAIHYGQGAAAAVIRGIMAYNGVRGPFTDFMFMRVRLLIDQTLENATGVGAHLGLYLPILRLRVGCGRWWTQCANFAAKTWPVSEQVIDFTAQVCFCFCYWICGGPVDTVSWNGRDIWGV
jgi:hypothetical protein